MLYVLEISKIKSNLCDSKLLVYTILSTSLIICFFIRLLLFKYCHSGETSSGKSSLLNLFMGEQVLPTKLLSCTSVACELFYGEPAGKLVTRNLSGGQEVESFEYKDRDQYIYKKTDRHETFRHTVQLWVPLPLLKVSAQLKLFKLLTTLHVHRYMYL